MEPMPHPDPATCLASLTRRLQQLEQMDLPLDARGLVVEALAEARALAPMLNTAPGQLVDQDTFDRLMDLAGPEVFPKLLHQLAKDLATVDMALAKALSQDDRRVVGAQTHTLLALAGSVGATPLYIAAKRLNRASHDNDASLDEGGAVLTGLAELRRFIDDIRHKPAPDQQG
jgi:HPt (histidine-containing phosphotransfer) domain-containing protein